MRSFNADDKYDRDEAKRLGAEKWQLELLKLNPEYVFWGPHEDYMWKKGEGWDCPVEIATWKEFGWRLDELNECAHFYFQVRRAAGKCECDGTGYNPATKAIADDFYDFANTGRKWNDKITQDECDALTNQGRLREWDGKQWQECPRKAEDVNRAQNERVGGMLSTHDAINRGILVETRAKRLGVYGLCPGCEGHGDVFTEPKAHASLVLWMLHPRKGCSRGVEILHLDQDDLPAIKKWLGEAAKRNADRFAKVLK